MANQVTNGKAFEWSMARELSNALGVDILPDISAENAEECFGLIGRALRERFEMAADRAVSHVLSLESETLTRRKANLVRIQSDGQGVIGDVRDIVVEFSQFDLGFSCKTNHEAFKHPRLGKRNKGSDWVSKWGINPEGCSSEYWETVTPIFDELSSARQAYWRDEKDLHDRAYNTILDAWSTELEKQLGADDKGRIARLVQYLIGRHDFYKVICRKGEVDIQAYNLDGGLATKRTKLPDRLIGIEHSDAGQYSRTVRMNEGFTFNFRIHSAESLIKPSMKFDITGDGLPTTIYQNHIKF